MPVDKASRNPYDLQTVEGRADFVTILIKQRDIHLLRQIDEVLIKIADRTFLIAFTLNLPILLDLTGVIC